MFKAPREPLPGDQAEPVDIRPRHASSRRRLVTSACTGDTACVSKAASGLATRYDKTPESYAAGLHLRGSILWLRSLPALP